MPAMNRDWNVRAAGVGDLDVLVRFNCDMALETERKKLDAERVRAGVRRLIEEPELGRVLVVTDPAGNAVGAMAVTTEWSDWRNGRFWWIQSVYILPEFRRQGVFSALYRQIEVEARAAEDVCGLRLYVERENETAQATYLHLGMEETHYRLFEVDFHA